MIINKEKRIGIFLVPKTGSATLYHLFRANNIPSFDLDHVHWNLNLAKELLQDSLTDLETYKFYAFYRDPIERFESTLKHHPSDSKNVDEIIDYFYDKVVNYINAGQYHKEFNVFGEMNHKYADMKEFVKPQVHWFDFDINLTLLDYRNFSNNAIMLLSLFDIKIDRQIPKMNSRIKKISLSENQKQKIADMYRIDYEFLAKRGINFL